MPLLDSSAAKDLRGRTRASPRVVWAVHHGFAVMPKHVHLLISEPESSKLSVLIHAEADHVSKATRKHLPRFWHVRYYDFPCGGRRNASRSCPTFIAIRLTEDWWRSHLIENRVVLFTMQRGWKGLSIARRREHGCRTRGENPPSRQERGKGGATS